MWVCRGGGAYRSHEAPVAQLVFGFFERTDLRGAALQVDLLRQVQDGCLLERVSGFVVGAAPSFPGREVHVLAVDPPFVHQYVAMHVSRPGAETGREVTLDLSVDLFLTPVTGAERGA